VAFGGIETGGTKWVCAIGTSAADVRASETFPTTTPAETIGRAAAFFEREGPVEAVGIGSFGPLDADPASPTWGYITTTPKPGWANTDVAGAIRRRLDVPVAFDTDVNAAALAEHLWGAAVGLAAFAYVTVGTGIGGAAMIDGEPLHGASHPEFGHMRIPHDLARDPFPGSCPYHGDCWEGLASGAAMAARWGADAAGLDEPAWALEAHYLALGLVCVTAVLSPQRIVVGGGVASRPGLLERVRAELDRLANGYFAGGTDVTAPGLGSRSGVLGAIALAART
jgi:fructokinase